MSEEINDRITTRMDSDDIKLIDSFIRSSDRFRNRSEFLRQAALEYIRNQLAKENGERPQPISSASSSSVEIPEQFKDQLAAYVELGYFETVQGAIREFIRDGLIALNESKKLDRMQALNETELRCKQKNRKTEETVKDLMKA